MFRQRKRCYDVTLSRQEGSTTRHLASAHHWAGLAGGDTGRLFLTFGGPVRADRISYCPLDRVLTYKNLIYLLNLQFYSEIPLPFPNSSYLLEPSNPMANAEMRFLRLYNNLNQAIGLQ